MYGKRKKVLPLFENYSIVLLPGLLFIGQVVVPEQTGCGRSVRSPFLAYRFHLIVLQPFGELLEPLIRGGKGDISPGPDVRGRFLGAIIVAAGHNIVVGRIILFRHCNDSFLVGKIMMIRTYR